MGSFSSSIWKSLKFSSLKTGESIIESVGYRYSKKKDGNLVYISSKGYDNLLIYVAKRTAAQLVEQQAHSLFPKYQRYLENKIRETELKRQEAEYKELIKEREAVDADFGVLVLPDHVVVAKNKYGDKFPEALILYCESDREIEIEDNGKSFRSNVIFFIDITATVSAQSSKNLILTEVQGRDFTRKELVSGGDINFSVNGKIVSDKMGVYPENDVKKFIQIAQRGGVIKVKHYLFKQFNVSQIIIKDFSLGEPTCKNVQPYSFSCVAVEPDEDVIVTKDTIGVINEEIERQDLSGWYKLILDNKLVAITAKSVAGTASSLTVSGLDALTTNI